jgi:hypothetical protein
MKRVYDQLVGLAKLQICAMPRLWHVILSTLWLLLISNGLVVTEVTGFVLRMQRVHFAAIVLPWRRVGCIHKRPNTL